MRVFVQAGLTVGLIFGAIAFIATLDVGRAMAIGGASFLLAGAAFTLAARGR